MKLLGRTKALKVYDYIRSFKFSYISVPISFLQKELNISKKSLYNILNYLEIAGYIDIMRQRGMATNVIEIASKRKPTQNEIDFAAVIYEVYKQRHKDRLLIENKKNGSVSPNILLFIYFIRNINECYAHLNKENNCEPYSTSTLTRLNKFYQPPLEEIETSKHKAYVETLLENEVVKKVKSTNHCTLVFNNETYVTYFHDDYMIIERHTNGEQVTYEIGYQAFESMYNFIIKNIDIQRLVKELIGVKTAKQRKKLPSEDMTLPRVNKTEYRTLNSVAHVKKLPLKLENGYSFYKLFTQKALLINKLFTLEERRKIAQTLYMEFLKTEDVRFELEFGTFFPNGVRGLVKAAVTALVYGYVPHGLGITQIKKYVDGLRYFIKNDDHYKAVSSLLFSVDKRYKAYVQILDYVVKLWDLIVSGNSKVSDFILKRIEDKWINQYTSSEKRFVSGLEKAINKTEFYQETIKSIFKNAKNVNLLSILSKNELIKLTTDNILYHRVVRAILNSSLFNFGQVGFLEQILAGFELENRNGNFIQFTFSDLVSINLRSNLIKLYNTTGYLTNRLSGKPYKEDLYERYQELFEQMSDYLLERDYKLRLFKDKIKPLIKKIVDITRGKIWQSSLAEYVNKIVDLDIDFISRILDYAKEKYEPYFLEWHGHRLVRLIVNYFYDNGIEYVEPEEVLHRISKYDPDLAFEEDTAELLEELAV